MFGDLCVVFVLAIEANVSNSKVSVNQPSSLQVSLGDFGGAPAAQFAFTDSHLEWLDFDQSTQRPFLWTEGVAEPVVSTLYQD